MKRKNHLVTNKAKTLVIRELVAKVVENCCQQVDQEYISRQLQRMQEDVEAILNNIEIGFMDHNYILNTAELGDHVFYLFKGKKDHARITSIDPVQRVVQIDKQYPGGLGCPEISFDRITDIVKQ